MIEIRNFYQSQNSLSVATFFIRSSLRWDACFTAGNGAVISEKRHERSPIDSHAH